MVVDLAPTASEAVIPIQIWADVARPSDGMLEVHFVVIGTGFFVDRKGDFITAGHVIDALADAQKQPNVKTASLTAGIPQKNLNGGGGSSKFDVIERDPDHDIVLCHLPTVHGIVPLKPTFVGGGNVDVANPYASLAVSTGQPVTGRFVVVSGFPLYAWTPAVQFGMVAATKYINPNNRVFYEGVIHKDGGELLQISVSGNHGNSGGPVIDLETGKVVGMIDQFVPAPLQLGKQILTPDTFSSSGIMLAAPAKWIEALLEKHNIKSEALAGEKWMTKWP